MPDSRFFETLSPLSVVELAAKTGGEAVRGGDRMIGSVAPLSSADGGAIAFMGDRKFVAALAATQAPPAALPAAVAGSFSASTPAAVRDWGVDAVCDYLAGLELGHLAPGFRSNGIDGKMLLELSEEELVGELGLTKLQAKKVRGRLLTLSS